MILVTGQSESLGSKATPSITTTNPTTRAKMLTTTRPWRDQEPINENRVMDTSSTALVNLVEADAPVSDFGETILSGMANYLLSIDTTSGLGLACVGMGGSPFASENSPEAPESGSGHNGANTWANAVIAAQCFQRLYGDNVPEIAHVNIHGIADNDETQSDYEWWLEKWHDWHNYYVGRVTGQVPLTEYEIPMFLAQMSTQNSSGSTGSVPMAQLQMTYEEPTMHLVAPVYTVNAFGGFVDSAHWTATAERAMGEYFGKVIDKVVRRGETWKPLRPASITRTGAVIDIVLEGNVGQVVLDTTTISDAESARVGPYGFTYEDDTSGAVVSTVAIVGENTVRVTLDSDPGAAANKKLSYAYDNYTSSYGAQCRGNVRDSDTVTSNYGTNPNLYNWMVQLVEVDPDSWTKPSESSFFSAPTVHSETLSATEQTIADRDSMLTWLCADTAFYDSGTYYDKSGRGANWSQPDSDKRPSTASSINSETVFTFDGAGDVIFGTQETDPLGGSFGQRGGPFGNYTVVFAGQLANRGSTQTICGSYRGDTTVQSWAMDTNASRVKIRGVGGGSSWVAVTVGSPTVCMVAYNNEEQVFKCADLLDAATETALTTTYFSRANIDSSCMAGAYRVEAAQMFSDQMGDLLIFQEDLFNDSTFRTLLVNYLKSKYGIA